MNRIGDDEEEALAAWEALLLPNWRWEALDEKDDGLYYGRVKSPYTYGSWEYGYFSREQLEEAQAYRVDEAYDDYGPIFPELEDLIGHGVFDPGESEKGGVID